MTAATIAVRTSQDVKQEAQQVFKGLGLDMSTAINMFLRQSIVEQALPFRPSLQDVNNAPTRYAETRKGSNDADSLSLAPVDSHDGPYRRR
ncbi:type II toxin-antitoxin system RelB/DinJ family antitoxin [Bifidobacterium sp.]|jgi:DNA-damage-inducible protein J|uniref:type II toxin-antitoxin system RelB/DinJ family antitoxin n=1 Tax=Bifidobacterium sp. TaxID=41200 RepID=UPI0025BE24B3|nr:type II toxin-antitoxin system RelB/DinJ family antitoxin [Bifidobacterium sp.]MCH4209706.1 type II toxin-antitoxin system RelB/DinJ family antitoxin [Bifidobacterium sp.]MCI1224524.1 type II toxin-antitoxin system RelB/DinJ family antitoxin [Bifidobacterium sp.]